MTNRIKELKDRIKETNEEIKEMQKIITELEKNENQAEFDEFIGSTDEGSIVIYGYEYSTSYVFKKIDEKKYNQELRNWNRGLITEKANEIEELENQIEEMIEEIIEIQKGEKL